MIGSSYRFFVNCWVHWALAVVIFCAPVPGLAVEVAGLTDFDSLVRSRDADERARVARRGLSEVVVRIAGSASVLREPPVLDALERAETYLVQARYETTGYELPQDDGTRVPADRLRLTFSRTAISELLRGAGLPVWGNDRPVVLAWVVLDESRGETWIGGEDDEPGAWLAAHGRRRGLPVQFPLHDLTDQMAVSSGSIRQAQVDALLAGARRYGADHLLAGVIKPTAGGYRCRWLLVVRGEPFVLEQSAASLDDLTSAAVQDLADRMAARYAVRSAGGRSTPLQLTVEGLRELGQYANLTNLLNKLTPVQRVELAEVRGATLLYNLEVEGSISQFIDLLALSRHLRTGFDAAQDSSGRWRLHYHYQP